MHLTASRLRGNPPAVALLLSLCLGFPARALPCPPCCLCASDIICCSASNLSTPPSDLPGYTTHLDLSHNYLATLPAGWTNGTLERLATLILCRNRIGGIEANAFAGTPRLLHLDLSSNKLSALDASMFAGLKDLRELLLFGNQIVYIPPDSFSGLPSIVKLYLSGNQLTSIPVGLMDLNWTFLDLSSNKLSGVHVHVLLSRSLRGEIYLQGNPLVCDCALLALLEYWTWTRYRPLVDFRDEYPCGASTFNCSLDVDSVKGRRYQVDPGKWVWVSCPGFAPLPMEDAVVFWVTPTTVLNSSTHDPHARLAVLPNGSLEIRGALMEDSGSYACVAARGRDYDPDVVLGNTSGVASGGSVTRSGTEHFNTAFTTLASCVVSIVLVLLYLYLTPCRCTGNRGGASRGCGGRAMMLCSDPREVEAGQRRSNGKRVAFLEPQAEDANTGGAKSPTLSPVTTEGILKNGSRTVGQTLTDTILVA
ncbi:amphoterin-induced protein 2-like [Nerophis ophidion]|uniref:amphoterin-induced protein 2-like n=1 Tax=Nerophis ophidion TaxID=159077 RepID=UPI002ADFA50F|nr:amphoterin-induced protein 2-like [Nerophis ophidion]